MPTFISNGPNIPESLLREHEDGNVVFFCGAGISYPAGLPGFKGLVEQIYSKLGTGFLPVEQQAFDKEKFDITINLLEKRFPGHRVAVRQALHSVLQPKTSKPGALDTHNAILDLAKDRKGTTRLITTNFDRLFRICCEGRDIKPSILAAPYLPVPKRSKWEGIVHIHGELPETCDNTLMERIVLSSGDFGLAYLAERWAARFVTELFKNFTVCFIGYSIDDPVVRYLMDALAAEAMLGEAESTAYAFAGYDDSQSESEADEIWQSKGVVPILYNSKDGHIALHESLKQWASTYRVGATGKKMVIAQHAVNAPIGAELDEEIVERVLWALTDPAAAKHFSELSPVPPIEWLETLSESRYTHKDLPRFGIRSDHIANSDIEFSFLQRPVNYDRSTWMELVHRFSVDVNFDDLMFHIVDWLTRHLDNIQLIYWILRNGGNLHPRFAAIISHNFDEQAKQANNSECDPKLESDSRMAKIWGIILSGKATSVETNMSLYYWWDSYSRNGLTSANRIRLREILSPYVKLNEPYSFEREWLEEHPEVNKLSNLVRSEVAISCEYPHSFFTEKKMESGFKEDLPRLLNDFSMLLTDACDLMEEMEMSELHNSYVHQPSISEHPQNRDFHAWTILIELTRDAWLETLNTKPDLATRKAEEWIDSEYVIFKRLALFAATYETAIDTSVAIRWLLHDDAWWIWAVDTQREVMRLLVSIAKRIPTSGWNALQVAILNGPPREKFRSDITDEDFLEISERRTSHILAKLVSGGAELPEALDKLLSETEAKRGQWAFSDNQQDEFPFWLGESGFVNPAESDENWQEIPTKLPQLKEWLINNPDFDDMRHSDGWMKFCREFYKLSFDALLENSLGHKWQADRLGAWLRVSAEKDVVESSWPLVEQILKIVPDDVYRENFYQISQWLQSLDMKKLTNEKSVLDFANKIWDLSEPDDNEHFDDPLTRAINHPVGKCTEAVLNWYYSRSPKYGHGIDGDIKITFTKLCNLDKPHFNHARVLLSAHAINLYRLDINWSREFLLPLFSWSNSRDQAIRSWSGFLWAPRIFREFLIETKDYHLDTFDFYAEMGGAEALGDHEKQFVEYFTFAAIGHPDIFDDGELADALDKLPNEGLTHVAFALARAIDGIERSKIEYWNEKLYPFIMRAWPKSAARKVPEVSYAILEIILKSGDAFPLTYEALHHWLLPAEERMFRFKDLSEGDLCSKFPKEVLSLLDQIIKAKPRFQNDLFSSILTQISTADASLANDPRYQSLKRILE